SFSQGAEYLDSKLSVTFNEYLPKESWLYIFMNKESVPRGEISLERYLHDEDYYEYSNLSFDYNITADGTLRWNEYPEQELWYRITVSGMCGNESCFVGDPPQDMCESCSVCYSPGPPYPCEWSSTTGVKQGTVNANPAETGLKLIYDLGSGGIPDDVVPGSVTWSVQKEGASPPEVDLSMREVCGNGNYKGKTAWSDGWIVHTISKPSDPCTDYVEGFDCMLDGNDGIDPFDDVSMTSNYRRFGGPATYPSGGVFKTNDFVTREYQDRYMEVNWNGAAGEIILKDFDSESTYLAVYLPPNGPNVCAYTSKSIPKSSPWSKEHMVSGASAGYLNPYVRLYTQTDLESFTSLEPPDCPIPLNQQALCDKDDITYGTEALEGDVAVSDSFDDENLIVTGAVSRKMLTNYDEARIDLSEFNIRISDLTGSTGNHTVRAVIDNGTGAFEKSMYIYVCQDNDGDGYCVESGDCNDTNVLQNPGRTETCNGVDDDCNGKVDDGIAEMGENLGKPCWSWPGSVCRGVYVCNPNGTELVCKSDSGIYPGDRPEYCDNMLDDDCDKGIDEDGGAIDGVVQPACLEGGDICIEGQERPCGQCGDGTITCINGVPGDC
ncbi:MAG: putative metal-binding motif-containing protein, partial [Candidatus Aenigmarchaeota archaeon]|nr:putative metal-binding motif-containing protein [Candidatus Aenigmarchaeota archaeon]